MKIADVQPIEEPCTNFLKRSDVLTYTELPVRDACLLFWDKNIMTVDSSANRKNLGTFASVTLDLSTMSSANQNIAQRIVKEGKAKLHHGNIMLVVSVNEISTVDHVAKEFIQLAQRFSLQKLTWGYIKPQDLLHKSEVSESDVALMAKDDIHYDSAGKVFWASEEL